jgi:hypothetical protein
MKNSKKIIFLSLSPSLLVAVNMRRFFFSGRERKKIIKAIIKKNADDHPCFRSLSLSLSPFLFIIFQGKEEEDFAQYMCVTFR